jgi:hypothetical protein
MSSSSGEPPSDLWRAHSSREPDPDRIYGAVRHTSPAPLGIGLLGWVGWLLWNTGREGIKIVDACIAVILDMVWVVGSYALLLAMRFSSGGKWAVTLVAELVFLFAVIHWLGLRRIGRSRRVV